MDHQPAPATLFIYAMFSAVEVVIPITLLIAFIWLAVKTISFLAHAILPDGGLSRREQVHRHRLENLAAFMTFAAFISGGVLLLYGDTGGTFKVTLPGGVVMENVGVPVIFLGFASSLLWMLLKAKASQGSNGSAPQQAALVASAVTQGQNIQVGAWVRNMTYAKAGVITLVLLPLIQVFAIPVGIFLFWMAASRDRAD
jgi:hypothetical protein